MDIGWGGVGVHLFKHFPFRFFIGNLYRRLKGIHRRRNPPNLEIGFGFVSCSCRECERAGEAKLCGFVREDRLSTVGLRMVRGAPLWPCAFCLSVFVVVCRCFCFFHQVVARCVGFLSFGVFNAMCMFLRLCDDRQPFVGICAFCSFGFLM